MEIDFSVFLRADAWISLLTLTLLEIVLGIDNIIFISLTTGKLPREQQRKARNFGLLLAMGTRILLLCFIGWILGLTKPLFTLSDHTVTGRDLILFLGGLFLIYKSTSEIHGKVTGIESQEIKESRANTFTSVLFQIALLDIVFSFDSVLTAVGLAKEIIVMILAVVLAMLAMMFFAGPVGKLVTKYPTLQILALSFLILIGVTLIMESLHYEVDKKVVYVSVLFSLIVELMNIRYRKKNAA